MHNDFYGNKFSWFVGTVREVIDATYVRVRIFGIHPAFDTQAVPDSDLPLALVSYPVTGDQVTSGASTHNLAVDSWVIGFFVDYPFCQQPIVTAVINGTDMSMSNYKTGGGEFVGQGSAEGSDTGEEPEFDPNATTNIPGGSNPEKVYNYVFAKLQSEGSTDPHLHASAIVGALQLESTARINPAIVNSIGAWGICQWLGPRRRELFRRYGRTKRLDQQLDFMWWEMNNTERRAKNMLLSSTNLADAVAAMSMFERAEDVDKSGRLHRTHSVFRGRFQYANKIYNTMKSTGTPTTNSAISV
ncbi:baseplate hub subunit and tail lysozyme protein [Rhizobium phage RHph_I1_18]|nr:baseplate hub subunit and tail lysozyme protein [Rhizobium phage RHph_I1_18]